MQKHKKVHLCTFDSASKMSHGRHQSAAPANATAAATANVNYSSLSVNVAGAPVAAKISNANLIAIAHTSNKNLNGAHVNKYATIAVDYVNTKADVQRSVEIGSFMFNFEALKFPQSPIKRNFATATKLPN